MASSRWTNASDDAAFEEERKRLKEEKKRLKAEKDRKSQAINARAQRSGKDDGDSYQHEPPSKRRRTSVDGSQSVINRSRNPMRRTAPEWYPCRSVGNYERLNHIEEGSYGWVSRAKEIATGEVVALKKLKVDSNDTGGFPVTGLREIQCLQAVKHKHIVDLREIVVGSMNGTYIVMEFIEHDLKTLQEEMQEPFAPSEVKTLLTQLTSAVDFLHSHWILHRDLKTSNILMSNRGEIKIADFGMARFFGDPPPAMTQLVVTLWYRAPELLLGEANYGEAIDLWSVGCIFGELLLKRPLLTGKNEVDQLSKTFELCGIPTEQSWPGFRRLPNAKSLRLPANAKSIGSVVRSRFPLLTAGGSALLSSLLELNPSARPSAKEVLAHTYFAEDPKPKSSKLFPSFPSRAGLERRHRIASPSAPKRGEAPKIGGEIADFSNLFAAREAEASGAGFELKLV